MGDADYSKPAVWMTSHVDSRAKIVPCLYVVGNKFQRSVLPDVGLLRFSAAIFRK